MHAAEAPPRAAPRRRSRCVGRASHTNRFGVTYYLHAGATRTGRPRYFVRKQVDAGALAALPEGFEFAESVNGVVSVRRIAAPSRIPPADVELVRGELAQHAHLRGYLVEAKGDEIVVHEPLGLGPLEFDELARAMCTDPATLRRRPGDRQPRVHPVMKFECRRPARPEYVAYRMRWIGDGGWLAFASGSLGQVVRNVRLLGTEELFELM